MALPPPAKWRAYAGDTLPIAADTLHLWRIQLDRTQTQAEHLARVLPLAERQRAQQFYSQILRQRFIVRRAVLRQILSRYLTVHPATLTFTYSQRNKPQLAGYDLQFNLSHSQDIALLGVATTPIGVDVEYMQPISDMALVAKQHFSPVEQAQLFALPSQAQTRAFYRCWTRKEAFIKADGRGLGIALDAFDVTLLPQEPAAFTRIQLDEYQLEDWWLYHVDVQPDAIGAVAAMRPFSQIQHYDFSYGVDAGGAL